MCLEDTNCDDNTAKQLRYTSTDKTNYINEFWSDMDDIITNTEIDKELVNSLILQNAGPKVELKKGKIEYIPSD